jgi:hypothetical protein
LRTYASLTYQAGSWTRPRKVVARLECSLRLDVQNRAQYLEAKMGSQLKAI